jgi:hypothetical protein
MELLSPVTFFLILCGPYFSTRRTAARVLKFGMGSVGITRKSVHKTLLLSQFIRDVNVCYGSDESELVLLYSPHKLPPVFVPGRRKPDSQD